MEVNEIFLIETIESKYNARHIEVALIFITLKKALREHYAFHIASLP